jgi:hypothetical protein
MDFKCLQCVAVHKKFLADQNLGKIPEQFPAPVISDAITLVASWQQQVMAGQIVMACVTIPACMEHIEVEEMSAEQKSVMGGRLLQGTVQPR